MFHPTLDEICEARQRISPHVRQTPAMSCPAINECTGASVIFKCENMQHGGSFKARGASNAILSLPDAVAQKGVVAHSSGNHAIAVARAATMRGIPASIVMPRNSAVNKLNAVKSYGITPILSEPTAKSRQETADAVLEETGGTLIHPYDDVRTIAGQGTIALELIEQVEQLDILIVPVGGGGMLAGCLLAAKALLPKIQVIAAEPALADDAYRSLQSGRLEQPLRYDTVADGLRTPLGTLNFPIIRQLVDGIILVDESEIVRATRTMLEVAKLVVEPSGAVPLAALMKEARRFEGQRVGIVLSGGNLNLDHLPWSSGDDE